MAIAKYRIGTLNAMAVPLIGPIFISPAWMLLQLVQNTYMNWLLDRTQRAAELDTLSRIVARVPVRRIVPHCDPARVGALSDLIVLDAERLFATRESAALLPTR